MNAKEMNELVEKEHDSYKKEWEKGKTIEFMNYSFAIVNRANGNQVQAITAISMLQEKGYKISGIASGMNPGDHKIYLQKA